MKIICLGKNYRNGSPDWEDPAEPVIFLKPDSSLLHAATPFFLPEFSRKITAEAELAVRICRLGKYIDAKFAHKYYDAFTVAVDFTAQDIYDRLSVAGAPIDIAKGFDGAAALGRWVDKPSFCTGDDIAFSMRLSGRETMAGQSSQMVFSIDRAIEAVSRYYTLKIGDVILTGAPGAAVEVTAGDTLGGFLGGEELLSLRVK